VIVSKWYKSTVIGSLKTKVITMSQQQFKFNSKAYEPVPQGWTGYLPTGTDDSTSIGGGTVQHEFSNPVPTNLLNILVGVTVGGAGAGAGTGTLFTTVINAIKVYRGKKTEIANQKPVVNLKAASFLAAVRASLLRAHTLELGIIPTIVDPVIAANATLYGANMDLTCQLEPGTYTLQIEFLASTATSYPGFATPPVTVAYNVACMAVNMSKPVEKTEIWDGNTIVQSGLSVSPVREIYIERAAAIATTINRFDFDINVNAYGVQAASTKQAAIMLVATGAGFPFYRSSQDGKPHPVNISFSGAAAAITYVAIA
jgi:hypothetical protein